jgi:hypothetical protein
MNDLFWAFEKKINNYKIPFMAQNIFIFFSFFFYDYKRNPQFHLLKKSDFEKQS